MDFYRNGADVPPDADPADAGQWGGRGKGSRGKDETGQQDPFVLYGLDGLLARPDAPVLLLGSQAAADAAQKMFPTYACLSWCRSLKSARIAGLVDLAPLNGRSITIWPDAGQDGRQIALKIMDRVPIAFEVDTAGLADAFDATCLRAEVSAEWLKNRLRPVEPKFKSVGLDPVGAAKIPPRPWVYGNFLMSGHCSVLGAFDGGGKGLIVTTMIIELVTGRSILGERLWRSGAVAVVTYEDDLDEWHRRLAAACLLHQADYEFVLQNVRFLVREDRKISFCDVIDGQPYFPDREDILAALKAMNAVALIVDPFNHAHNLEDGNSNVAVAKVAHELEDIPRKANCSLLMLHHLRKGSNGTADDLMGATSLRATARAVRILMRMTRDEAVALGITEDAWRFIRIAGSKENYSPPPDKSFWYKLESQSLDNGTEQYPDGDNMGVATRWKPSEQVINTGLFGGMSGEQLLAVFEAIRDTPHSPSARSKQLPWVGTPLQEFGGRNEDQAKTIIKRWLDEANDVLRTEPYKTETRNDVQRAVLNDVKVAEIVATYCRVDRPPESE